MHEFAFESYGVKICVRSNRKRVIERVRRIADNSLLGRLVEIEPELAEHIFTITRNQAGFQLDLNGEDHGGLPTPKGFYNFLESRIRVTVAEYAKNLVFMHAGAVAWKGKGVIFPADSFQGKTTLIATLVKRGAVYYSDDYAILDENGYLHPFPRKLSLRVPGDAAVRSNRSAASLGGVVGVDPIPVSAVIITRFRENGKWRPRRLSPGNGIIQMIRQAIPLQADPQFSLKVLKIVASRATIVSSVRSDIDICVSKIADFIDIAAI